MKSIVCWAARRIGYMELGEVRAIARKMIALGEESDERSQGKSMKSSTDEEKTDENNKVEYAQTIIVIMS